MFSSFDPDPITQLLQRLQQKQPADATRTPPPQLPKPLVTPPDNTVGAAPAYANLPPMQQPDTAPPSLDRTAMTGGLMTDLNAKFGQIANRQGAFSGFTPFDLLPVTSQMRGGVEASEITKEHPLLGLMLLAGALVPESSDAEALTKPAIDGLTDKLTEKSLLLKLAAAGLDGSGERAAEAAGEGAGESAARAAETEDLLRAAQKVPAQAQKVANIAISSPFFGPGEQSAPPLTTEGLTAVRRGLLSQKKR